ncbi:hypothetical protein GCM10020000_69440 [Streptomyces olivoverticillatus]
MLRHLVQQPQDGESDRQRVGRGLRPEAEHPLQRPPLYRRKRPTVFEYRGAQLVQGCVEEIALELRTGGSQHLEPVQCSHRGVDERRLADTRLARHHDRPTAPDGGRGHQSIELTPLCMSSHDMHWNRPPSHYC